MKTSTWAENLCQKKREKKKEKQTNKQTNKNKKQQKGRRIISQSWNKIILMHTSKVCKKQIVQKLSTVLISCSNKVKTQTHQQIYAPTNIIL